MPLTLIKEDGTGRADANSYANVTDGDAFHAGHLYATAWTGATADNKAAALVMAARVIDAEFQFNGVKASAAQALQWPRYAQCLRALAEEPFPQAEKIVLVQDNLNTHAAASLYEAFEPTTARRLLERFECHDTPKHGRWLNMAEIELSVLSRQCLDRRMGEWDRL